MRAKGKIKVAIFGHYTPIYRKGVLEKLSFMEDIELTVCSTADFPAGLRMIKPEEVSFSLLDIRTHLLRIPFTKKTFSLQPAMLSAVLGGSHDVYILPNTLSYLDVWACLAASRLLGRKVCLWGHGKGSLNGTVARWFRKLFMNSADALVFYSDAAKKAWQQSGIPKEKMFVAYNALDTDQSARIRTEISGDDTAAFTASLGLQGKKIIVFTGRLLERKRPDLIVEAMALVVGKVPEAHAILIGAGPMRETIEMRVRELALETHVTMAGAIFEERSIAHYLLAAKIAVIPSHAGLFIQHAFAYGLPIVVGDNLRLHPPEIELVQEGETGLFFRDADAAHLAERLLELFANEEKRQEMSVKARKTIENKYNVDSMARGLSQAIRYSFAKGRTRIIKPDW
ncbi:MAG TPA: hypothetical protein DCZ75_02805 [Geobacter sp.]|nr:hypothetical protein [Geobacter sp.]